ncbi:MAG TPA: kelch repeat-containing protein [Anaeromyxobacter sp.]|nr:kelch repeat-containing protein [Anaeromyxobacter sp.]
MNLVSMLLRARAPAYLLLAFVTGCGGGGASENPAVLVSPASASVLVGGETRFAALVGGGGGVIWTVVEGPAGGSVFADGRYVAPRTPGAFHVRAASADEPGKWAQASVTVTGYARRMQRVADGSSPRDRHTATILEDGTVLVVGGLGWGGAVAGADRYLPGDRSFVPAGSLAVPRIAHGAAPIPGGRVLVAGGWDPGSTGTGFDPVLRSSEIWDPASEAFSPGPEMVYPRRHATFTVLPDGSVFVAGGLQLRGSGFGASPNTEIYRPASNTFVEGPRMVAAFGRWQHSATLLDDGRVLLVGGRDNNCETSCLYASLGTAEIYDPATGRFAATGSLRVSRFGHAAIRLPGGQVLVLGGTTTEDLGVPSDQVTLAESWDPTTGEFSPAGATLEGRSFAAVAELLDRTVLLAGGWDRYDSPVATTEIFDPGSGASASGPEGSDWRQRATATMLRTGEVLIVGGHNSGAPVLPVDLFR